MTRLYSLLPLAALLSLFELGTQGRQINEALLDQYDYIIVGGGASGLTVANRLTEDPSVTVLVLEAGPVDEDEEWMRVPFFVGNNPSPPAGSLSGHQQYDWNLGTEAQTYLDGRTRHYPLGRGVGGGTLINGMLWNRGNIGDYDDWATLIGDDGWNWQSMLQYFKRSETFTADFSAELANEYQIHSDMSVHGTAAGGVNVSYQGHFYNGTSSFYDGLNELGVPTEGDPNAGATAGASFLPMSIDPELKTRSDARRTHYDPHASRDNLYISSGQFVTRLIWDGDENAGDSTETGEESGSSSGNGQGGSSTTGSDDQTNPADPTNPFSAVTSSVDGVSVGSGKSTKPSNSSNPAHPSGSAYSNMTVPTWANGSTSASIDGSTSNGQGRHWGLKIADIEGGLSSGLGIFNLFDNGNLFDLLKSSAPVDWDPSSGVEVHEVVTTSYDCACKEKKSCSANSDDKKQKKAKRQTLPNLRVAGVEYAATAGAERHIITAKREVILAAGAVHTPLILQHSGVGESDFLSTFDIETRIDLPGVGQNYQDHYMIATNNHFQSDSVDSPAAYADATDANREQFWTEHTGPWTAGPPNGVAFPSLKDMTDNFTSVLNWAESQGSGEHLQANIDPTVIAGYERQKELLLTALADSSRGQFEILNNNAGSFTYSLMKPLSRGQISIRSANPFDTPVIDPRYGSNPIDLAYMMEALRFNERLIQTTALTPLDPAENYPTAEQVADDARLLDLIKGGLFTEYHPTGTASMLPLEDGGVVDAELRVYGTQNLRIIDGSIMPLIPAAHLQACVYGVAEKAADLIRGN